MRTEYSRFAAMLGSEFQRYLMQHPEKSKRIPRNALAIFQVEGEEGFNLWGKQVALKNRERGQRVIYVSVKGWRNESSLHVVKITPMVA